MQQDQEGEGRRSSPTKFPPLTTTGVGRGRVQQGEEVEGSSLSDLCAQLQDVGRSLLDLASTKNVWSLTPPNKGGPKKKAKKNGDTIATSAIKSTDTNSGGEENNDIEKKREKVEKISVTSGTSVPLSVADMASKLGQIAAANEKRLAEDAAAAASSGGHHTSTLSNSPGPASAPKTAAQKCADLATQILNIAHSLPNAVAASGSSRGAGGAPPVQAGRLSTPTATTTTTTTPTGVAAVTTTKHIGRGGGGGKQQNHPSHHPVRPSTQHSAGIHGGVGIEGGSRSSTSRLRGGKYVPPTLITPRGDLTTTNNTAPPVESKRQPMGAAHPPQHHQKLVEIPGGIGSGAGAAGGIAASIQETKRILPATLYLCLESIVKVLHAESGAIFMPRNDEMVSVVNVSTKLAFPPSLLRHMTANALTGGVYASGVAIHQENHEEVTRDDNERKVRSLLLFPIIGLGGGSDASSGGTGGAAATTTSSKSTAAATENRIGVIQVVNKRRGTARFDAKDENIISSAAFFIAQIMERHSPQSGGTTSSGFFDWHSHYYDPITLHNLSPFVPAPAAHALMAKPPAVLSSLTLGDALMKSQQKEQLEGDEAEEGGGQDYTPRTSHRRGGGGGRKSLVTGSGGGSKQQEAITTTPRRGGAAGEVAPIPPPSLSTAAAGPAANNKAQRRKNTITASTSSSSSASALPLMHGGGGLAAPALDANGDTVITMDHCVPCDFIPPRLVHRTTVPVSLHRRNNLKDDSTMLDAAPSLIEIDSYLINLQDCWRRAVQLNAIGAQEDAVRVSQLKKVRAALNMQKRRSTILAEELRLSRLDAGDYLDEYQCLKTELKSYMEQPASVSGESE